VLLGGAINVGWEDVCCGELSPSALSRSRPIDHKQILLEKLVLKLPSKMIQKKM
jgi:hypothetical protein